MDELLMELSKISPADRILLLPHCLRQSNTCKAVYNQEGLQCAKCNPDCAVNRLSNMADECGYKGICVAPGGRLAIKYVEKNRPLAIVAVACQKELEEGVQGVKALAKEQIEPLMIIIPLTKDGCVDTQVDVEEALTIINTGCMETILDKKS